MGEEARGVVSAAGGGAAAGAAATTAGSAAPPLLLLLLLLRRRLNMVAMGTAARLFDVRRRTRPWAGSRQTRLLSLAPSSFWASPAACVFWVCMWRIWIACERVGATRIMWRRDPFSPPNHERDARRPTSAWGCLPPAVMID